MGLSELILGGGAWRGPVSDHFDGRRFHNRPSTSHGFRGLLRWALSREQTARSGLWPDRRADGPAPLDRRPPERSQDLVITVIGHATVLIQLAGQNILTDPIFSERASPLSWSGPRRCRAPGIPLAELPPIDLILISHNHYDHLDRPSLDALRERHDAPIIAPLGNRALLERDGHRVAAELDWWQSAGQGPLSITATPARHFSSRSLFDRDRTLWAGYLIAEPGSGRSVFFAGDTGFGPHFAELAERLGAPDVALLPIGGYKPRWFMEPVHIDPPEAVRAHRALGAGASVAIHFGTFPLSDEGMEESVEDLRAALTAMPAADAISFHLPRFGEALWSDRLLPAARSARPTGIESAP